MRKKKNIAGFALEKAHYTPIPNFEFQKKFMNFFFITKNVANKFINSSIDR